MNSKDLTSKRSFDTKTLIRHEPLESNHNAPRSSTTGRPISSGASAKQSWQAGDTVNVGFVRGLEVVKRIPTPGDFAPDAYALWQPATGRFYRFVPHNGLQRCDSLADALAV